MLIQGQHAKRGGTVAINPREAGNEVVVRYTIDVSAGVTAASDVLEFGPLPAFGKPVDATLISEGIGAALTATVGLLTGEASNADNARALVGGASNMLTAASINNTEVAATKLACMGVPAAQDHRGIGATVSGNITAGAGKKLHLVVKYIY